MDKHVDARELPNEAIEEKRHLAYKMRKRGLTRAAIGEIVGVHADTVGRWLKLDKNELALKKSGRKNGSGRSLSSAQEQQIKALLIDKTPDQLKMPYALWTREAISEVIRARQLELAIRTVGD